MATGHILPGYNDSITRLQRAKSAHVIGSNDPNRYSIKSLDSSYLDEIRQQAREAWSIKDREATSYNAHYYGRTVEPTLSRPTSPTRKNKPHPPQPFLTTRLHYIPGYHNADTRVGKSAYRVDGSVPAPERAWRSQFRDKFVARPATAAVGQFKRLEDDDSPMYQPKERNIWNHINPAEAEEEDILAALKEMANKGSKDEKIIPSLRGYLKQAGYNEARAYEQDRQMCSPAPPVTPNYYATKKDSQNTRRSLYKPIPMRGDFLLHPDWPPTIPHHRLPCLC